jgi:hypothetical protein
MKQLEKIARKLTESLPFIDIVEGELSPAIFYPFKIFEFPKSIGFKREANTIIQGCVDDILDIQHSKYGPLFKSLDNEHVYDFLTKISSDVKQNPDSNKYNLLLRFLDDFIKNLKIFTFHSYIKIGNLKISKIYDFNSFKFIPINEIVFGELITWVDDEAKQKIIKDFQKDSNFFSAVMELQISALDEKHAKTKTLQNAIDILNVFKALGAIGIIHEGETQLSFHNIYLINQDTRFFYQMTHIENYGKIGAIFDIDSFGQDNLHLVKKLQSCFNLNNASPLERKMTKSLIWFGESLNEPHPSHRLLKMIIAIETLLLDSDDIGTKRSLLKERAAFLLGNTHEVRCLIEDTMEEAYRVRNSIVHSGDKYPIPLRLIKRVLWVVHDLNILFLTSEKFKTFEDIRIDVRKKSKNSIESH